MHTRMERPLDLHAAGRVSGYGQRWSRGVARLTLFAVVAVVSACDGPMGGDASHQINSSVHVAAGAPPGSAATVNGSIVIDDNAAITSAATVNGSIHLGAHATAESLKSVNGEITLDAAAHVAHSAESVNGALTLRDQAEVLGALANVNGSIELANAHVAGGIRTVMGSITIMGDSRVEGGILVKKPSGISISTNTGVPRIVIGPGAKVQGDLRFEREVRLYVSDRATVGPVTGAAPVTFAGDTPPA